MSVATVHKPSQAFPTLDVAVFKSYLDKDKEIKSIVNPKLFSPEMLNIQLDVTAQKWSFPLRIWLHLLKKSLMEKFIFCGVFISWMRKQTVQ